MENFIETTKELFTPNSELQVLAILGIIISIFGFFSGNKKPKKKLTLQVNKIPSELLRTSRKIPTIEL